MNTGDQSNGVGIISGRRPYRQYFYYPQGSSVQKGLKHNRVIPIMVFMRSNILKGTSKRSGSWPPVRLLVILSVSITVVVLAAVSGAVLKGSNNMCTGCHGDRYEEFCNLLPLDPLSVLPAEFLKGDGTTVNIAVDILNTGDSGSQSYFLIDILRVTLSSTEGRLSIPGPQQQRNNLYPGDKPVFEWTITGQSSGQDTLRFDLYAHNPHKACTADDVHSYGITVTSTAEPPGQPGNLGATPGNGFVMLSWQEPLTDGGEPITGYEVHRGGTPGSGSLIDTVPANTLEYNDTSVTNGMDYYYSVKAVNAEGSSPASGEVTAMPLGPPSAPRNIRGAGGNSFAVLSWDPPADDGGTPVLQYIIRRSSGASQAAIVATPDSIHTSYNDTGLTNGVEYRYSATAVNSMGESPPGISATVTPDRDATIPDAPANLSALSGDGHILITWDPPLQTGGAALTGYKVYETPLEGNLTLIADLPQSQLSFDHTDITNGLTYRYTVTALNRLGESAPSASVEATPRGVPTQPGVPETRAGRSFILLSWALPTSDGGSTIIKWSIHRGPSPDDLEEKYLIDHSRGVFNDTNVTCGQVYHYAIGARNAIGQGPLSSTANATPGLPASPPEYVRAVAGHGYVEVFWESPEDDGGCPVTGYALYRRELLQEPVQIALPGPEARSTRDGDIIAGTRYFYSVRAVTAIGNGTGSEEAGVTAVSADGPEVPELKFASLYPDSAMIDTATGEVLVFSTSLNRNATIIWYVDGNIHATGINTLSYPVIDEKDHTIAVKAVDDGGTETIEHSWTVNTGKDSAEDTSNRQSANVPRGVVMFAMWGGLLLLAALAVWLTIHYGKRSK